MVRNVKLGHGLFDLIKTEQAARVSAKYLKILFCESPSKLIIYLPVFRITLISLLNFFCLLMMLQQQSENEINKKKAEQMKNEWQPPKLDSSSEEESDEEIGEDVELSR